MKVMILEHINNLLPDQSVSYCLFSKFNDICLEIYHGGTTETQHKLNQFE